MDTSALPPDMQKDFTLPHISDDNLFAIRDLLLPDPVPPASTKRSRGGRPWQVWKHQTNFALRQAGIGAEDRQELMAALGLIEDE
jgi:hypothetical protein